MLKSSTKKHEDKNRGNEEKYPLLIEDDDLYVIFLNDETRSCSTCPFRGFCGK